MMRARVLRQRNVDSVERGLSAMPSVFSVVAWVLPILSQVPEPAGALQTVAERSGYRATAPIYDADGNERVAKTNRPGQVGPEEGMGQRANARGLDLNRDFIKLEAPETQGLVRFLNEWNPHLFIDTHTTNGSYHRYTIT